MPEGEELSPCEETVGDKASSTYRNYYFLNWLSEKQGNNVDQ